MDIIHIEKLICFGKHGVYEKERSVEQEFQVDIELKLDMKRAGESDKLSDTIDYDEVKRIAESIIKDTKRYLIEKIAEEIAGRILEKGSVQEVRVSIRKVAVWENGVPGVTVMRSKK